MDAPCQPEWRAGGKRPLARPFRGPGSGYEACRRPTHPESFEGNPLISFPPVEYPPARFGGWENDLTGPADPPPRDVGRSGQHAGRTVFAG
jgi:hypothetical protein